MSRSLCVGAVAVGLVFGIALADNAAAQGKGRSGGAPWGAGGPSTSTFDTPFSSGETKTHTTDPQGWSDGEWGARGQPEPDASFNTPGGPPSSLDIQTHTTGKP